jgi:hypothetical protein
MQGAVKWFLSDEFREVSGVFGVSHRELGWHLLTSGTVSQVSRTVQHAYVVDNGFSRVPSEIWSRFLINLLGQAWKFISVIEQFVPPSGCLSFQLMHHHLVLLLLQISLFALELSFLDQSLSHCTSEVLDVVNVIWFVHALPNDYLINWILVMSCVFMTVAPTSAFRYRNMRFALELGVPLLSALLDFILSIFCCLNHVWQWRHAGLFISFCLGLVHTQARLLWHLAHASALEHLRSSITAIFITKLRIASNNFLSWVKIW